MGCRKVSFTNVTLVFDDNKEVRMKDEGRFDFTNVTLVIDDDSGKVSGM